MTQHVDEAEPHRKRSWRVVLPTVVFALIALLWAGFWYYAESKAEAALADWRGREARSGRIYSCGSQTFGGFPFRIEVRCADPSVQVLKTQPPFLLKANNLLAVAQAYDPTLLIAEVTGPLTLADPGRPPNLIVDWTSARASVRGASGGPQRVSVVLDKPKFSRPDADAQGGRSTLLASAEHMEWHGRVAGGSLSDNPVLDVAVNLVKASAPGLSPLASEPIDADVTAQLTGLRDLAPKSWAERFREIQANGGHLDITSARVQQGGVLAVATGTLRISPHGRLDGDLQVSIAGIEKLLPALGLDQLLASLADNGNLGSIVGQLDRLMPGLGGLVRSQSGARGRAAAADLGRPTQVEGRRALTLPLRFSDGAVFLGPFAIGQTPPVY